MVNNTPPVGRIIGMTSNMLHRAMAKRFANEPHSASETAFISFICDKLNESPERMIFQRDIEKEFNLRSPSASETIKSLEQKGLLTRKSLEGDGRKKKLIPTQIGIEYDKKIKTKLNDFEKVIISGISPEDLEVYRRVSKQMIDNLRMEDING